MATQTETATKERTVVYLAPDLSLKLRLEKARTKRPVTDIVEDLVREHYRTKRPRPTTAA